jgi:putative tricarboxylic transport membrane protein
MALMERLGWIPATTLLFMAAARAFGSRRWLVDGALGLTVAVLSFVIFNYGLDLNLPAGILTDLIEPAP